MMVNHYLCIVECWHEFVCAFPSQSDYAAMAVYPLHYGDEVFCVLTGQPTWGDVLVLTSQSDYAAMAVYPLHVEGMHMKALHHTGCTTQFRMAGKRSWVVHLTCEDKARGGHKTFVQFILAKKGALGTIWIVAHLDSSMLEDAKIKDMKDVEGLILPQPPKITTVHQPRNQIDVMPTEAKALLNPFNGLPK